MRTIRYGIAITGVCLAMAASAQTKPPAPQDPTLPPDKYIWLEENSPRTMDWVKAEDARTAKVMEADPRFAQYSDEALKVLEDPNRLPMPSLRGDQVYNFWQDQNNVRGVLRRTSPEDFSTVQPHWQTVLDIDALGKQENKSWVFHGLDCLYPGDRYCMVALSVGGEDASTEREFDLRAGKFVESGFTSPHSKQNAAWEDKDTLLIARDWGPGTMTKSGYAFVVKEWKRGTPLDSAQEVFRGQPDDIFAAAGVLHDAQGDRLTVFIRRVSFFETRYWVQTPQGLKELTTATAPVPTSGRTPTPGQRPMSI